MFNRDAPVSLLIAVADPTIHEYTTNDQATETKQGEFNVCYMVKYKDLSDSRSLSE